MIKRVGHLHEDSALYERRDRAGAGLGKGEFLSQRLGRGMVMGEELEVEELMSAGMGVKGSSGWYFAFSSRVLRWRKRKDSMKRVGGEVGCEGDGVGVGRLLMGGGVDVDDRYFLSARF